MGISSRPTKKTQKIVTKLGYGAFLGFFLSATFRVFFCRPTSNPVNPPYCTMGFLPLQGVPCMLYYTAIHCTVQYCTQCSTVHIGQYTLYTVKYVLRSRHCVLCSTVTCSVSKLHGDILYLYSAHALLWCIPLNRV